MWHCLFASSCTARFAPVTSSSQVCLSVRLSHVALAEPETACFVVMDSLPLLPPMHASDGPHRLGAVAAVLRTEAVVLRSALRSTPSQEVPSSRSDGGHAG